jgi:exonuclease VII large subunit
VAHAAVLVDGLEARVRAADPAGALARGWTLTRRADGALVRSSRELAGGDLIVTTFADGTATSRVETTGPTDG